MALGLAPEIGGKGCLGECDVGFAVQRGKLGEPLDLLHPLQRIGHRPRQPVCRQQIGMRMARPFFFDEVARGPRARIARIERGKRRRHFRPVGGKMRGALGGGDSAAEVACASKRAGMGMQGRRRLPVGNCGFEQLIAARLDQSLARLCPGTALGFKLDQRCRHPWRCGPQIARALRQAEGLLGLATLDRRCHKPAQSRKFGLRQSAHRFEILVRFGLVARQLGCLCGQQLHHGYGPKLANCSTRLASRIACVARCDRKQPTRDRLVALARAPCLTPFGKTPGCAQCGAPQTVDQDQHEPDCDHQHGEAAERCVESPACEFDAGTAGCPRKPRRHQHRNSDDKQ